MFYACSLFSSFMLTHVKSKRRRRRRKRRRKRRREEGGRRKAIAVGFAILIGSRRGKRGKSLRIFISDSNGK